MSTRWGDDDDSSVEDNEVINSNNLPPTSIRINNKGVKILTSYKINSNGQTIKTVTESKVRVFCDAM